MTTKMFTAVACLGAAMGFASRPAAAQTMTTVKVNLPYEAKVGNVLLPAGHYSIHNVKDTGSSAVLQITSDDDKLTNAFVTAHQVVAKSNAAAQTKVVLHQDDNGEYKLDSIFVEGQSVGFELNTAAE